jgi:hypothetical protein
VVCIHGAFICPEPTRAQQAVLEAVAGEVISALRDVSGI